MTLLIQAWNSLLCLVSHLCTSFKCCILRILVALFVNSLLLIFSRVYSLLCFAFNVFYSHPWCLGFILHLTLYDYGIRSLFLFSFYVYFHMKIHSIYSILTLFLLLLSSEFYYSISVFIRVTVQRSEAQAQMKDSVHTWSLHKNLFTMKWPQKPQSAVYYNQWSETNYQTNPILYDFEYKLKWW